MIPENAMSDPSSTDPLRRVNLRRANVTGTTWTALWTWLAAIAAAAVVLGLAFQYDRSDLARNHSRAPTTTGSATGSVLPASLSVPRPGDVGIATPAMPGGDQ